jgi:hypothetical protein
VEKLLILIDPVSILVDVNTSYDSYGFELLWKTDVAATNGTVLWKNSGLYTWDSYLSFIVFGLKKELVSCKVNVTEISFILIQTTTIANDIKGKKFLIKHEKFQS